MKTIKDILLLFFVLIAAGCTTTGITHTDASDIDFGETEEMRICFVADDTIPPKKAYGLMASLKKNFAEEYAIDVKIKSLGTAPRPGFGKSAIFRYTRSIPLGDSCDRVLYLVGRNLGDFLWGLTLFLPEYLGVVDAVTYTKAYVVAEAASPIQLVLTPERGILHEGEHLIGCRHAVSKDECYANIVFLKSLKRKNRKRGRKFFPSVAYNGTILWTSEQAEQFLHTYLRRARKTKKPAAFY